MGSSGASGGGAGAVTLIASQVLAAPAAAVTFAAIPQSYNHLELLGIGRSAQAAVETDRWKVQLNGDTAANYDVDVMAAINGVNNAAQTGAQTSFAGFADMPAASATAGRPGMIRMILPSYAQTTFQKIAQLFTGYMDGTGNNASTSATGTWLNTAAVTSITITTLAAANLLTGSAFYLYGLT